jgi:Tfp pilus assembly protein FimT
MELLWVMAILATVCTIATPHFIGPLNQMALEKKAREIYMAIAYTKQQAVNQNGTFGVFFDVTAGQQKVTCYQNKGYDGGSGEPLIDSANMLLNRISKKPYVIWVDEEDEYGNAALNANFGGKTWVEFGPLGVPNETGLIKLAGNDFSHTITVSKIGRLSLE